MISSRFESPTEIRREEHRYFMGVDLGQSNDPSTVAVIRRVRWLRSGHVSGHEPEWVEEKPSVFQCGYLERIALGTTYVAIVAHVGRLLARPVWCGNITLALDRSGVGRAVADLFSAAGISFAGVTIVGGDTEARDGKDWRVPKLTLVSQLQALLHEGRLHIQKDLQEAATLVRELQDFRVNYTASGNLTFSAREGKHDDLVLALAIAVWRSRKRIVKMKQIVGSHWMER